MFSVVIPLFNKANYIEKAIHSILSQTCTNFEIIVIDDGSTDEGNQVVKSINDHRIHLISQFNSGASVARNNGVKLAKYEYVAFLDADDWWDCHFLEEMKNLVIACPEAALLGSNYFVVKHQTNYPAQIGLGNNFKVGYIDYFKVYSSTFWVPINCSFVVVNKNIFEKVGGFKPQLKFGEDFDLWARLALGYKTAYVNKYLAYSNQDVDPGNRALGLEKKWKKAEHVIFNLGYLEEEEKQNTDLKYLLDGLRVRSLAGFYLAGLYNSEVSQLLPEVDFSRQPFLYWFIYKYPRPVVHFYFRFKKMGSQVKQWLFKHRPLKITNDS